MRTKIKQKLFKIVGIIAMISISGFLFTACGGSGDDHSGNGNINGSNNDNNNSDNSNTGITYTVTYNSMGAVGTPPGASTVVAGTTIIIRDDSGFSITGYILKGWYTNNAGTRTDYTIGSSYIVTGNVIFYADWVIARKITLDINNGTGEIPSLQTVMTGTDIFLPTGIGLARNGYIFNGWNTNAAASGINYTGGSVYTVNSDVTLYARWDAIVEGTWVANKNEYFSDQINYLTYTLILNSNSTFTLKDSCQIYWISSASIIFNSSPYLLNSNGTYKVTGSVISLLNNSGIPLYTGTYNGNNTLNLSVASSIFNKQ